MPRKALLNPTCSVRACKATSVASYNTDVGPIWLCAKHAPAREELLEWHGEEGDSLEGAAVHMTQPKIPTTSSLKRDASGTEVLSVEALADSIIYPLLKNVKAQGPWRDGFELGVVRGIVDFRLALRRRDAQVVAGCDNFYFVDVGFPRKNTGMWRRCLDRQRCIRCIDLIYSHEPSLNEKEIEEAKA